jgi:Zn-dependent membrane protease YugP
MMIWVIVIFFMLLGWVVSARLKSKFKKYSETTLGSGLSGKEIAEQMLHDHGIRDVRIISVEGQLTDHYNPTDKTVNLSHEVYYGRSAAAAAVSAHEVGHAVQHATAYSWLQFRSAMVPIVTFGSKWVHWVLLAGVIMLNSFPQLLLVGIVMFGLITLFSFITLPVEFDASNRALAWLQSSRSANTGDMVMAKDALKWAAMTYVVAALASLATLLYYVLMYLGRRD